MGRILILGGTGKIGSATVEHLDEKNADFSVLVRNHEKCKSLEEKGINCIAGDYTDPGALKKALKNVKRLLLLVSPHIDMAAQEKAIIAAAKDEGVVFILKISAVGAPEDKTTHIGQSHGRSEKYLKSSGIDYCIFRPHSFMQNLLVNLPTINEHGAMYGTMGNAAIPLIDARDIGEAAANVLMDPAPHDRKAYALTGPESITFDRAAAIIGEMVGSEVRYVNVPDEAAKSAMVNIGMPEWIVDDLLALNEKWRSEKDIRVSDDLSGLLSRSPHTFESFVRDHRRLFS